MTIIKVPWISDFLIEILVVVVKNKAEFRKLSMTLPFSKSIGVVINENSGTDFIQQRS
ncbi:MAG: hypothetical protein K6T90_07140 [Leptolyngbyaceae cyanobacterium HOT.MB2.61]|nr:hypothetical protein [Leptolyngbyaceae cyanobacterium HOT.MB2.61]